MPIINIKDWNHGNGEDRILDTYAYVIHPHGEHIVMNDEQVHATKEFLNAFAITTNYEQWNCRIDIILP